MNTQRFIAAAALVLAAATAGTAYAGETAAVAATSTLSRADVLAELARARAAGEVNPPGESYSQFHVSELKSTTTRAEVVAELARARAAGEVPQAGEAYDVFALRPQQAATATASARTREEVRAEARRAARDRTYDVSNIGG